MRTKHGFGLLSLCLLGALTACAAQTAEQTAPESTSAPAASAMTLAAGQTPAAQTPEETDVDLSDIAIPEELADACVTCGGEVTVRLLGENEIGPVEETCISCLHGTDAVFTKEYFYQLVCQNPDCESPYKSKPWIVTSPGRRVCYGW